MLNQVSADSGIPLRFYPLENRSSGERIEHVEGLIAGSQSAEIEPIVRKESLCEAEAISFEREVTR
jgi:hypothetical protein